MKALGGGGGRCGRDGGGRRRVRRRVEHVGVDESQSVIKDAEARGWAGTRGGSAKCSPVARESRQSVARALRAVPGSQRSRYMHWPKSYEPAIDWK